MAVAPGLYRFGRWQLDTQRCVLCADGKPVQLHTRAFEMLALLVAKHGEVVSRDEIVAHVWKGLVVGENNLTVQMSTLRRVLGDSDDGAPLIVTVPGRGYRFTGEVVDEAAVARIVQSAAVFKHDQASTTRLSITNSATTQRIQIAAVSGLFTLVLGLGVIIHEVHQRAPLAPRLSIAVLPFRNISSDHTQDYLADALTDDLTTDLAHIPGSTVIARASSETYHSHALPVQSIGLALHVRYLVDGSLHVEDGRYFANVQLLDAITGQHLWTSRLAPVQGRLSEVRDAIVHLIASALGFQLEQIESARSVNDRPDDPDALDLFLRARAILDCDTSLPGLTRAQRLLEGAIAQQPRFGDALAELGAMLLTKVHDMDDPTEDHDFAEAREMTTRALAVASRNALALATHARALTIAGKWAEASSSAAAALAIEPSSVEAESVLAKCAQVEGHFDEAVSHIEAILRLIPNSNLSKTRYVTLGLISLVSGQLEKSMAALRKAIAGDEDAVPTEGMGRIEVTNLLLIAGTDMLGRHEEAHSLYETYRSKWRNRTAWRFAALFDRSYTRMQGFRKIIAALENAGMPIAADEHVAKFLPQEPCPGTPFDETPSNLSGGETLDTAEVIARLKARPRPLLVDVGRGVALPPNAVLYAPADLPESAQVFALRVAGQYEPRLHSTAVIIMGEGTYGCNSFLAATTLIAHGYRNVSWYRGGEEAWATAGQPYTDRRPE